VFSHFVGNAKQALLAASAACGSADERLLPVRQIVWHIKRDEGFLQDIGLLFGAVIASAAGVASILLPCGSHPPQQVPSRHCRYAEGRYFLPSEFQRIVSCL